jgi:hypothetical protein
MTTKRLVYSAAFLVLGICVYAFLLGSEVFEGKFKSDPIAWYFLAKGVFCSLSLVLTREVLGAIRVGR